MPALNRQLVLSTRPEGDAVGPQHFEMRTTPVPTIGDNQYLVRIGWIGFDPAQRGWLNDVKSYVPPVQIGEVMRSSGVGQVVASNSTAYPVGTWVSGMAGWQDYVVGEERGPMRMQPVPEGVDPKAMLGVFGTTGLTAYFGMIDVGAIKAGDAVLVSGAAGATGSVAGQIARIKGASTVVGIAGGAAKCEWVVKEAGFDACIDYKSESIGGRVRELFPKGVDVYFDNVGGEALNVALGQLAMKGRIVLCGGISSGYGTGAPPPGPSNYFNLVIMRGRMEGFILIDYLGQAAAAREELVGWVRDGALRYAESEAVGLEHAPDTLRGLFEGRNLGKQILKVADPPFA